MNRQLSAYTLLRDAARAVGIYPRIGTFDQYPPRPLRLNPAAITPLIQSPRISVVVPSLNSGRYLGALLGSLASQDYAHLEVFVQDGGSTDDTATIISKYDSLITHAVSMPDRGQSHALNLGFGRSTGAVMAYLNADDLLLPGTLHQVAGFFATNPGVDAVYGHRVVINADGHEIGRWVLPPHDPHVLRYVDYIPQETLFWRRSLWERIGSRFDEDLHYTMDWDLLLRFANAGAVFYRLPHFLGAFRVHAGQKTGHPAALDEMERLRARYGAGGLSWDAIHTAVRWYKAKSIVYHGLWWAKLHAHGS